MTKMCLEHGWRHAYDDCPECKRKSYDAMADSEFSLRRELIAAQARLSRYEAAMREALDTMTPLSNIPSILCAVLSDQPAAPLASDDTELDAFLPEKFRGARNQPAEEPAESKLEAVRKLIPWWESESKRCYELAHRNKRRATPEEGVMAQAVRFWECSRELKEALGEDAQPSTPEEGKET